MSSKQVFDCPELLGEAPLLNLNQATNCFPVKCSRATLERWIRQGTRGVQLETIVVGNRRFTTEQAIQRFLLNQQQTESEKVTSMPTHRSMSSKAIAERSQKYGLPEPQEPSQN